MVDIEIEGDTLVVRVLGWSRLAALKREIRVPLSAVRAARPAPDAVRGLWKGWRMPGTEIPGVITSGTFYRRARKQFFDVRRGGRAIEIELEGASYDRLVVDVQDPDATLALIRGAKGA